MGLFWDVVDNSAHLGGQIPQNPYFGCVNRHFWAKCTKYYQNYRIDSNQILHNDKDH